MCRNFRNSKVVPIPPPPKFLMSAENRHKPFQYCRNVDHSECYVKSVVKESSYAHSIEELAVWTVERHYSEGVGGTGSECVGLNGAVDLK